jgi:hypothetical protein
VVPVSMLAAPFLIMRDTLTTSNFPNSLRWSP